MGITEQTRTDLLRIDSHRVIWNKGDNAVTRTVVDRDEYGSKCISITHHIAQSSPPGGIFGKHFGTTPVGATPARLVRSHSPLVPRRFPSVLSQRG